jgi:uncharacterized protein YbjQ (UPF0145 family)
MKKLLLTTTETLQGWDIESYLSPIFSNVVIGPGWLSDLSAGLTDIFGGRSENYEKKLQTVNDNALVILQSKAAEKGANAIVGLKINVHQISGKQMQMFMVSAYGTAVIARNLNTIKHIQSFKEIDKTTLNDKANLIELLNRFKKEGFRPQLEDIQLIVESKSIDFVEYMLKLFIRMASKEFPDEIQIKVYNLCIEYFLLIRSAEITALIFKTVLIEPNRGVINKIARMIDVNDLLDYNQCLSLLRSDDIEKRKLALQILVYNKSSYINEDRGEIESILTEIDSCFPNLITVTTKKGFLSSNEKEVWVCTCKNANSMSEVYCVNCYKDQYGFKIGDIKPKDITDSLKNKAKALSEIFIIDTLR